MRRFPATERFLGGETVRYRDLAKTGLFGATERVLPPIPDNTDNGDPVYGLAAGTPLLQPCLPNPTPCRA